MRHLYLIFRELVERALLIHSVRFHSLGANAALIFNFREVGRVGSTYSPVHFTPLGADSAVLLTKSALT